MSENKIHTTTILDERIMIIGLGHVGLTLGLAFADVGFQVAGFDIKDSVRTSLRAKQSHFKEKGLANLLEKYVGNQFTVVDSLTTSPRSTVYFVTVGTPFNFDNTPDYNFIKQAAGTLGETIQKDDLIILRSTVPIGTTRETVIPIIEKVSGLKAGIDFSVAFAPERTVEGNAFHELRTLPQIVGGVDVTSKERTAAIFRVLTDTIVELDTLEEAEIVKLINNTYRETVFAYANQVSLLARAWGIDTKKIITAANTGYARSQVSFPSPGVGGYCLTKDAYLYMASAKKKKVDTSLLAQVRESTSRFIDQMKFDIINYAKQNIKGRVVRIGILGFAFKGVPETSDVRGSTTFALTKRFNSIGGYDICGYDPVVSSEIIAGMFATPKASIQEVIDSSDIVVTMNNHPLFAAITPQHFSAHAGKPVLFFDTWGLCDKPAFDASEVTYWRL